jgi:hypothetical protein
MAVKYVTLPDGKRYLWREVLKLRREQAEADRRNAQPTLFELHKDSRPASQQEAAGRYREPTLFPID